MIMQYEECPCCYGEAECLGVLGRRAYYRCVDCGSELSFEVDTIEDLEEEELSY